jgi:hypothetical protein
MVELYKQEESFNDGGKDSMTGRWMSLMCILGGNSLKCVGFKEKINKSIQDNYRNGVHSASWEQLRSYLEAWLFFDPPACSLVCLTILRPWRWRRYVPPKRRVQLYGLHSVISQKIILFTNYLTSIKATDTWSLVFKLNFEVMLPWARCMAQFYS